MGLQKPASDRPIEFAACHSAKQQRTRLSAVTRLFGIAAIAGAGIGAASALDTGDFAKIANIPQALVDQPVAQEAVQTRHVYYRYCSDARAAGVAPIRRGEPGYGAHLDRDNDGIACEPYRGRR